MGFIDLVKARARADKKTIVLPESMDRRTWEAAETILKEDIANLIIIGTPEDIADHSKGLDVSGATVINPQTYEKTQEYIDLFVELRKAKGLTPEKAKELMFKDYAYYGCLMIKNGDADGMVSGACHSTADTLRPCLQIIKTKPGVKSTSGAFIMLRGRDQEKYLFSDCAININPDAEGLAEIAVESAKTAAMFDIDPKVALLSFSTKGSAKSPEQEKVAEATRLAKEKAPQFEIDGELQFDAAFVDAVAKQKAPDSNVAGQATVFVFPEIQSGNIGYKIAQRFGNFEAIGPILQGMAKPISDLSRGCIEEDVYKLAIITANQAILED